MSLSSLIYSAANSSRVPQAWYWANISLRVLYRLTTVLTSYLKHTWTPCSLCKSTHVVKWIWVKRTLSWQAKCAESDSGWTTECPRPFHRSTDDSYFGLIYTMGGFPQVRWQPCMIRFTCTKTRYTRLIYRTTTQKKYIPMSTEETRWYFRPIFGQRSTTK